MNSEQIAAIRKRAEQATPGPWLRREDTDYYQGGLYLGVGPLKYVPRPDGKGNMSVPCRAEEVEDFAVDVVRIETGGGNVEFLEHAQVDILTLLAEIERLEALLEACEGLLPICRIETDIQKSKVQRAKAAIAKALEKNP